ncbi:MAG: hypothetical protein ABI831_24630, partial [Betaproteobacteria bacterium]
VDGSAAAPNKAVAAADTLDIDGNGTIAAASDGILVIRYMFRLRGVSLLQDAVGGGATRTTAGIESYLAGLTSGNAPMLDIDGNGIADTLTDGVMILRYLMGMRGQQLIQGTIAPGATRTSSAQVEAYLATLVPPVAQPQPPSGCSVTASPSSSVASPLAPSTLVGLTAQCTGGQTPISFLWNSGFVGSTRNVSPATTTTYSVTASNGVGSSSAFTSTVFVTPSGPKLSCSGNDEVVVVGWPPSGQTRPFTNGLQHQVESYQITIPFSFSPPLNITHTGFFAVAERPNNPVVSREMTITTTPCDMGSGNYLYSTLGDGNTAPTITFTVNNPGGYQAAGAVVNFQSGAVIYVNVRSALNGVPSCDALACDINFDFATPNRY